ncbi:hypothetical protein JGU66_25570 [Myxococcaceae bacterium JPH2]|nr:hypothetical protein [Myxococcaceae bacterium JPH2]
MKTLRWALCMSVFAVVGCGGAAMEMEPETTGEASQTEAPAGDVSQSAVTCTDTYGECRVGQCELGPNDHFQIYTHTCCTAAGACTTQRIRLCGC